MVNNGLTSAVIGVLLAEVLFPPLARREVADVVHNEVPDHAPASLRDASDTLTSGSTMATPHHLYRPAEVADAAIRFPRPVEHGS